MRFEVLGPVRVVCGDVEVDIGGPRQRRLLAVLLLADGHSVGTERLADAVLEGNATDRSITTIRSYVARLRRALDAAEPNAARRLTTEHGGYAFVADTGETDHGRFEELTAGGRQRLRDGDPAGALEDFDAALGLWRGRPYEGFDHEDWAMAEATRLAELQLATLEECNEARLDLGDAERVVADTAALVTDHPLRERLQHQRVLALYRTGRPAEALRHLERFRRELAEIGLEPSAGHRSLGEAIAAHDPGLALPSPAGQPLRGYEVGDFLRTTPDASLYRGRQPGVDREVAIRAIHPDLANDVEFLRRFDATVQVVATIEHPHVVPVYDSWRDPSGAYVITRCVERSLADDFDGGPLSIERTIEVARAIGGALETAHRRGVGHGALGPDSILVDDTGVYLADLGIAELLGTAPMNTALADQAALAAVLYQSLSGHLPFGPDGRSDGPPPSIRRRRDSVPAAVDVVMAKALAATPVDRFASVDEFVRHLVAALTGEGTAEPTPLDLPNPYRGLRAFTETDHHLFFGRDSLVDEIMQLLDDMQPSENDAASARFVIVVGASGSGKSSAVRAGVIPALRAGAVAESSACPVAVMTPGADPFGSLRAALRSIATADVEPLSATGNAELDAAAIDRALDQAIADAPRGVVVVDQFEELFTVVDDEAVTQSFVAGLVRAATKPDGRVQILATLRADVFDRPLGLSELGRLIKDGSVTVVGLSAPELEEAISRPAASVGVDVERGLAAQLVSDALDRPGALPLLQFALTELYDRRSGSVMTLQDYERLGGVHGAVARRAEADFLGLEPEQRTVARQVMLQLVVTDGDHVVARRRALRSALGADRARIDHVVGVFGASRLLSFDHEPETREPTVEVAHEALISEWPRFAHWVAEEQEGVRVRSQLLDAVDRWERSDRDPSDLYRGVRLESALDWADRHPGSLSAAESTFLDDGHAAQRAEVDEARRSNRRLRSLLSAVAAMLVVSLVLASVAVVQQRRADAETAAAELAAERADLATLISRSAVEVDGDPVVGLLLALEAHRRSPEPATRQVVLGVLSEGAFPNLIASAPTLPPDACGGGLSVDPTGSIQEGVEDGRRVSLDILTGRVTDHGPTTHDCELWFGDRDTDTVVTQCCDGNRHWVGTFDDPFALELDTDAPSFLVDLEPVGRVATLVEPVAGGALARFYDLDTGQAISGLVGTDETVIGLSSPDGEFHVVSSALANTARSGRLDIVDRSGAVRSTTDTDAVMTALTLDPASGQLIAGTAQGELAFFDPDTGEQLGQIPTSATSELTAVGVRPDGAIIAISFGLVEVIDPDDGSTITAIPVRDVLTGQVRPDGTVTLLRQDTWEVMDPDGSGLVERSWSVDPFVHVAFEPGLAALTPQGSSTVSTLDLATGAIRDHELRLDGEPFHPITAYPEADGVWAWSHEGTAARFTDDGVTDRLTFDDGIRTGTKVGHLHAIREAPWLSGPGGVAHLIDTTPGTTRIVMSIPSDEVNAMLPSADGGMHLFDADGAMHTYDDAGQLVGTIDTGVTDPFIDALDPSGVLAVLSSDDPGVAVVDPATGEVTRLAEDQLTVNVALADEGRTLLTIGFDGTVELWDVATTESIGVLWSGTGVGFSSPPLYDAENETFWVFSSGRLIELPIDADRWIERACSLVTRELTPQEWERLVPGNTEPRPACP